VHPCREAIDNALHAGSAEGRRQDCRRNVAEQRYRFRREFQRLRAQTYSMERKYR
jgi:hypothetical protein